MQSNMQTINYLPTLKTLIHFHCLPQAVFPTQNPVTCARRQLIFRIDNWLIKCSNQMKTLSFDNDCNLLTGKWSARKFASVQKRH